MSGKQSKRPAHINKAMKALRSYARTETAKTEIVQFRVDKEDFERLVDAATVNKMPMGAMIRNWVMDSLEHACNGPKQSATSTPMFVAEQPSILGYGKQSSKRRTIRAQSHDRSGDLQALLRDFIEHREQEMIALNAMFTLVNFKGGTKKKI